MNIAVCVKQVPDTRELTLDPQTNTLIRDGVESVLNPLDEFPLEAALRLREQVGGSVCAVTMGPPQAARVLEKAVAMGADRAVLVSDRAFAGADTWATSLTLAAALRHCGPFDLVLCGKQAIDGDTAQVGPGIAAHLGIAQVTYVTHIEVSSDGLRLQRLLDHGTATLRLSPPAVLTVLKGANEPRLPSLSGRLRALATAPEHLDARQLGLNPDEIGLEGSPTRVIRVAIPSAVRAQRRVEGSAEHCAAELQTIIAEAGGGRSPDGSPATAKPPRQG